MENVTTLCWRSQSVLGDLRLKLLSLWCAWCEDWGLLPDQRKDSSAVNTWNAWECEVPADYRWYQWSGIESTMWALGLPASPDQWATNLLWDKSVADAEKDRATIASVVAQTLAADLLTRLQPVWNGQEKATASWQPVAQPVSRSWSGALLVSLMAQNQHGARTSIYLWLSRQLAAAACERPKVAAGGTSALEPPVPVLSALAGRPLRLLADLGEVELNLFALESLQPGDVIKLPHRLDQPLQVKLDGKKDFCTGFLGRVGRQKAVELRAENNVQVMDDTK